MSRLIRELVLAAAVSAAAAVAGPTMAAAAPGGDAEIPFLNFGGIRNWTANGDSSLNVQAAGGQWYKVDLAGSCPELPFALRIGVDSGPTDTLDNFSTIIVDGDRCPVASVTQIAAPTSSKPTPSNRSANSSN